MVSIRKKRQIGYFIIWTNKHTKDKLTILTAVFSLNQIDKLAANFILVKFLSYFAKDLNCNEYKYIVGVFVVSTVLSVGSNLSPLSNCSGRKSGNHVRGYPIRVGNFQFGNRERFHIEHFKNHFISLHWKNHKMKIKFILRE